MSHITCPFCGSREHTTGYGLAAGPLGAYTFCDECDELLEFSPDLSGLNEEDVGRLQAQAEELRARVAAAGEKT